MYGSDELFAFDELAADSSLANVLICIGQKRVEIPNRASTVSKVNSCVHVHFSMCDALTATNKQKKCIVMSTSHANAQISYFCAFAWLLDITRISPLLLAYPTIPASQPVPAFGAIPQTLATVRLYFRTCFCFGANVGVCQDQSQESKIENLFSNPMTLQPGPANTCSTRSHTESSTHEAPYIQGETLVGRSKRCASCSAIFCRSKTCRFE
jgi:hypothetical protein